VSSDLLPGTTENAAQGASRPCATVSARRLRLRCRYLEHRLEQPGHLWRPVTQFVIFVAPSSINLILSGFQCADTALKALVDRGKAEDFRLNPLAGSGTNNLVTSSPRGAQLLRDACALATAHQD